MKTSTKHKILAATIGVAFILALLPAFDAPLDPTSVDGWTYATRVDSQFVPLVQPTTPTEVTENKVAKEAHQWRQFIANRDALKSPVKKHLSYYVKGAGKGGMSRAELNAIGRVYGIPDDVLFYQNHIESSGGCIEKPNHKGAVGCFQFIDNTAREFGLISERGDFRSQFHASADAAARYMLWLTIVMYGDEANPADWEQLRHVLAAYNAGYGTVTRSGKPKIPNFYETIRYVNHIEDLVKEKAVWVRKGDSLQAISARVGVPVEAILRGNPSVTGDHDLVADTVLSLPDANGMSKLIVKRGMSLYEIQGRTGVAVKELIAANRLGKDGIIRVGAVLNIPAIQHTIP